MGKGGSVNPDIFRGCLSPKGTRRRLIIQSQVINKPDSPFFEKFFGFNLKIFILIAQTPNPEVNHRLPLPHPSLLKFFGYCSGPRLNDFPDS